MHVDLFDHYVSRGSVVHRLDPRVKVALTILFILSNLMLPDGAWLAFVFSLGVLLLASRLSLLGVGYTVKRSFIALPFALAAASAIFAIPGEPRWFIQVGSWHLVASDAGLLRFGSILVRSWLSVQMAILLTAATSFPDLLHALRHLRAPSILVAVISFMYRYLFVLTNEAVRMLRAREARSALLSGVPRGGNLAWRARVAGNMAGQLFLRSYERSERVYSAMLARGYTGQLLTLNPHTMQGVDWVTLGIFFASMALLQFLARL